MEYIWDFVEKKAYNNRSGHYKTKVQYKFIMAHGKNKMEKIFDIAGGAGRFAIPLLDHSKNITVLDINEKAIQILKERNKNIHTMCGDFSEINIPGNYSLIICIEAIPYFKDWNFFFNKVNSLMDADGRLIFSYTNPNSWRFFLRKLKHMKDSVNPYTEMKFKDFEKLLNNCGLEIESREGMNWMPLPVRSNSILVDFFAGIEKMLMLNKWYAQSPWLMISVKKK